MIHALSSAISGIWSGVRMLNRSAGNLSRVNEQDHDVDLAREVVDQKLAVHTVKANIETIRTVEEMEESLLDIRV